MKNAHTLGSVFGVKDQAGTLRLASADRELLLEESTNFSDSGSDDMLNFTCSQTKILFVGFERNLAAQLRSVLNQDQKVIFRQVASTVPECGKLLGALIPDVVFCPADGQHYRTVLEAAKQASRWAPVVVVSRRPEVSEWLDAIEAGATDYCAPPFEAAHIQWILETCRRSGRTATA